MVVRSIGRFARFWLGRGGGAGGPVACSPAVNSVFRPLATRSADAGLPQHRRFLYSVTRSIALGSIG